MGYEKRTWEGRARGGVLGGIEGELLISIIKIYQYIKSQVIHFKNQ